MAVSHVDEVLGKARSADSSVIPRFTIKDASGNTIVHNATIELDNPIVTAGTPVNKQVLDECLSASGVTTGSASSFVLAQPGYVLANGNFLRVKFHVSPASSATLNVNGTGAKPLSFLRGASPSALNIAAEALICYRNNTYYILSGSDGFDVGDFITSRQVDKGPNWLLCNGSMFDVAEYPALFALIGGQVSLGAVPSEYAGSTAYFFTPSYHILIMGDVARFISITTSVATDVTIPKQFTDAGNPSVQSVRYINGQYVFLCSQQPASQNYATWYVITLTSPSSAPVKYVISVTTSYSYFDRRTFYDIIYYAGQYVLCGDGCTSDTEHYTYGYAYGAQLGTALTWYEMGAYSDSGTYSYFTRNMWCNSSCLVISYYRSGGSSARNQTYKVTTLGSEGTSTQVHSAFAVPTMQLIDNGTYLYAISNTRSSEGQPKLAISYTPVSLVGTFTTLSVTLPVEDATNYVQGIFSANGKVYILVGRYLVEINGTTASVLATLHAQFSSGISAGLSKNNIFYFNPDSSTVILLATKQTQVLALAKNMVPTIADEHGNVFIRGR